MSNLPKWSFFMVSFTLDLAVLLLNPDLLVGNLISLSFLPFRTVTYILLFFSLGDCRKGGPPAVTDANLLGRLIQVFFPKIFEKEPLDVDASRIAFEKLAKEIIVNNDRGLSLDEIVYG